MKIENLVYMANQIGDFYATEPDRKAGVASVASHIKRFWEPRMRRAIFEHIDQKNGEGLQEIVLVALKDNRQTLVG